MKKILYMALIAVFLLPSFNSCNKENNLNKSMPWEKKHKYIVKDIQDENVYYQIPNKCKPEERITVQCFGENCTNGCGLNPDKNGCTPCENPEGKCQTDVLYTGNGNGNNSHIWKEVLWDIAWTIITWIFLK